MNLADEIGVPGVNLNAFTSGPPTIDVNSYHDFLLGFENSLPWDRAERMWTMGSSVDENLEKSHVQGRRRHPHQPLHVGPGHPPRGEFKFRHATTAISATALTERLRECHGRLHA